LLIRSKQLLKPREQCPNIEKVYLSYAALFPKIGLVKKIAQIGPYDQNKNLYLAKFPARRFDIPFLPELLIERFQFVGHFKVLDCLLVPAHPVDDGRAQKVGGREGRVGGNCVAVVGLGVLKVNLQWGGRKCVVENIVFYSCSWMVRGHSSGRGLRL
jgi:hypothetical protein